MRLSATIFERVWRHRLREGERVVRVHGWRSALLESKKYGRAGVEWTMPWDHWNWPDWRTVSDATVFAVALLEVVVLCLLVAFVL